MRVCFGGGGAPRNGFCMAIADGDPPLHITRNHRPVCAELFVSMFVLRNEVAVNRQAPEQQEAEVDQHGSGPTGTGSQAGQLIWPGDEDSGASESGSEASSQSEWDEDVSRAGGGREGGAASRMDARPGSIASTYWRPERSDRKNLLSTVDERCVASSFSRQSRVQCTGTSQQGYLLHQERPQRAVRQLQGSVTQKSVPSSHAAATTRSIAYELSCFKLISRQETWREYCCTTPLCCSPCHSECELKLAAWPPMDWDGRAIPL